MNNPKKKKSPFNEIKDRTGKLQILADTSNYKVKDLSKDYRPKKSEGVKLDKNRELWKLIIEEEGLNVLIGNKKDSGWLLDLGVMGIDKTLKLVKLTSFTGYNVIDLELFFRPWVVSPLTIEEKRSLPFRKIPSKSKTDQEIMESILMEFIEDDPAIKSSKGGKRRAIHEWLLNKETFRVITSNAVGYQWELYNRIRAESLILWDAFQVINGNLKSMPESYSDNKVQRFYDQKNKSKIKEIIEESLSVSDRGRSKLKERLKELKNYLKIHDEKRVYVVYQMAQVSEELEKWGKESQL